MHNLGQKGCRTLTENLKTQGQGQRAGVKASQQRSQRISHEWFHTNEYSNKDQQQAPFTIVLHSALSTIEFFFIIATECRHAAQAFAFHNAANACANRASRCRKRLH